MDRPALQFDVALTPREADVCRLLREGLTDREISSALGVKIRTVKFHVSHLLRKFGVKRRLMVAVRCGRSAADGRLDAAW